MSTISTKFIVETANKTYRMPIEYQVTDESRIEFLKSPFALKDEIKSMKGARWHGFQEGDNRKIWSVEDCYRNRFQIAWLEGKNPYEWFDREVVKHDYPKFGNKDFGYYDLMGQQQLMSDIGLTYHYQIWAAEMGVGKTLSAIAVMVISKTKGWWWVGPKSSLYGIRQEFDQWGLPEGVVTDMMSYEGMMRRMREWTPGTTAPIGVIFDEAQRLKTPTAQRTQCAQKLADNIRDEHNKDGFVILMTGTPSPKSPGDWWSTCEIAWPGFIREGNRNSFESRLGFFRLRDDLAGQAFNTRIAWKNDTKRCNVCGHFFHEGHHLMPDGTIIEEDTISDVHEWEESKNEVAALHERLGGLAVFIHKKDWVDLPEKIYKEIVCEPSPSLLRVAGALIKTAPNVITGLTHLRELSDGFQYRQVEDGYTECTSCKDGTEVVYRNPNKPDATIRDIDMLSQEFIDNLNKETIKCMACKGTQKVTKYKRITREIPCPKEQAVVDLLEQNEEQNRIVFFAGFTGSLDRIKRISLREGWDTILVDGRGWRIERLTGESNENGSPKTELVKLKNPLDYWIENAERRIAFVAHPKSGGVSLTLCPQEGRPGAVMSVFYSNDYDPASRIQAEDRIHRIGMDENKGAMICDLFHLPTDRRVLEVLKNNRKLELMTMGQFEKDYENV